MGFATRVREWEVDLLLNVHSVHIVADDVLSPPRGGPFNLPSRFSSLVTKDRIANWIRAGAVDEARWRAPRMTSLGTNI